MNISTSWPGPAADTFTITPALGWGTDQSEQVGSCPHKWLRGSPILGQDVCAFV